MPFLNATEANNLGDKYPLGSYDLSPVAYDGTRLKTMASTFQKYRFRGGTKFIVQTQAPTISTGGYVVGYTENPDQDMGEGVAATNNISNLPGATSGPVWESLDVPVGISDKSKWYNVDSDTEEIMMAIQGKFVFQQTAPVSVLGDGNARLVGVIWLHYEIEFVGNCSQKTDDVNSVVQLPPGQFEAPTGSGDTLFNGFGLKYTNATTLPNTLVTNTLYKMTPAVEVQGGDSADFVWTYSFGSGLVGYLLAGTEDEAKNGLYLSNEEVVGGGASQTLSFTGAVGTVIFSGQPVRRLRPALNFDMSMFTRRVNDRAKNTTASREKQRVDERISKLESLLKSMRGMKLQEDAAPREIDQGQRPNEQF